MKSFNQGLKSALVAEIRKHREQDQVGQGEYATYGKDFSKPPKYCAIGCTIQSAATVLGTRVYSWSNHKKYVDWLGIPEILAELQDVIHEGLSEESFPIWPERFMEAVPTETDLSLVFPKFALWFLIDEENGILREAQFLQHREAIQNAAGLFSAIIAKEHIPQQVWRGCAEFAYDVKNMARSDGDSARVSRAACNIILSYTLREYSRRKLNNAIETVAMLRGRNWFSTTAGYYEKCAEKLIELLKAEGNDQQ